MVVIKIRVSVNVKMLMLMSGFGLGLGLGLRLVLVLIVSEFGWRTENSACHVYLSTPDGKQHRAFTSNIMIKSCVTR